MAKSKRISTERLYDRVLLHTDECPKGKPVLTLSADSLDALVSYLHSTEGEGKGIFASPDQRHSRTNKAKRDWDLSAGWDGAVKFATEGWQEGRNKLEKVLARLSSTSGFAPAPEDDVAGGVLDVPSFVAGDPCHYECDPEDTFGQTRVIRLLVPLSASCGVHANTLLNRGVALASAIDTLESRGLQTEVIAYSVHCAGRGQVCIRHTVKNAGEHLTPERLAASVCHPATFRRINFAGVEALGGRVVGEFKTDSLVGGYGYPTHLNTLDLEEAGTVLFPAVWNGDWSTPEAARKSVSKAFESAGYTLEFV